MNSDVAKILKQAYSEYGNRVFMDKNKLVAYMTDLLVDYPQERKRLCLGVYENVVTQLIAESQTDDLSKYNIFIGTLINTYSITEETAFEIVDTFCDVLLDKHLNYELSNSTGETKTPLNNPQIVDTISTKVNDTNFESGLILKKYKGLEEVVTVSDEYSEIADDAFAENNIVKKVIIPGNIIKIGERAFKKCKNLREVYISDGVKHIKRDAFAHCESLIDVRLPDDLVEIGDRAFISCKQLTSINIPSKWGTPSKKSFAINVEYDYMGWGIFKGCDSLTEVVIPEGVSQLTEQMFSGCDKLKRVFLPNSLTSIYPRTFSSSKAISSIVLPEKLRSVSERAFSYCEGLNSVTFLSKTTRIEEDVFTNCKNLVIKCYPQSTAHFYAEKNKIKFELM